MIPGYNDFTLSQRHVYHLLFHKRGRIPETEFLCWTKDLLSRMYVLAGHMTSEDLRAELLANWFPVIAAVEDDREAACQAEQLETQPKEERVGALAGL